MDIYDVILEKLITFLKASGWIAVGSFILWLLMTFAVPEPSQHDIFRSAVPAFIDALKPYILGIAIGCGSLWVISKALFDFY